MRADQEAVIDLMNENTKLKAVNDELVGALEQFVAVCDTAPPVSLLTEIGMACKVAHAALSLAKGEGK